MGETITVAEHCRGCPRVGELRLIHDIADIDPLEAADRAEAEIDELKDDFVTSGAGFISDEILDESKRIALRMTAERLDEADSKRDTLRRQAEALMESCRGLLALSGADHDGQHMTVHVCGSSALHGMSIETTRVDRP